MGFMEKEEKEKGVEGDEACVVCVGVSKCVSECVWVGVRVIVSLWQSSK